VQRHEVVLSPRAGEDLDALSPDTAIRIARKLRELESDPAPRGDTIKRLQGFSPSRYRLRVGDYRAVFLIEGGRVVVLRVIHRSELERAVRDLM